MDTYLLLQDEPQIIVDRLLFLHCRYAAGLYDSKLLPLLG